MEVNIALVCNPAFDNAKAIRLAAEVARILQQQDLQYTLFDREWPGEFSGFSTVWIFGGDGTVNHFINRYPDISIPLSVFPGGSANDMHWMLYGDLRPDKQVTRCLEGRKQWIDAGSCNGHLFLNGVGIGFDGAIVKDLLGKKKVAGKATYLLSVMKHIMRFQAEPVTFMVPGEQFKMDSFLISVANGKRYGGGFCVAPNAEVADGVLDLAIVGSIPPLSRMRYLPVIEKGLHLHLPFVRYQQLDRVRIETGLHMHAHIDGEYLHANVFEIECLPKKYCFYL